MPKLKTVEEVANRLEPIFTQSDAYEFDNGYTSLIPAIELAKQVITQDRQAIREALREALEKKKVGERPTWETGDPQWWDECSGGYNQALADFKNIIDELLGGEVTE